MLSFELSAIDLILAIAVIVLIILFISTTKSSSKTYTIEKKSIQRKISPENRSVNGYGLSSEEETRMRSSPPTSYAMCRYGFGYLKKLEKGNPIPHECLRCPRKKQCLGPFINIA